MNGIKNVVYTDLLIYFVDDHKDSNLYGERLTFGKDDRRVRHFGGSAVFVSTSPLTDDQAEELFGPDWETRVDTDIVYDDNRWPTRVSNPRERPVTEDLVDAPKHYRRYGMESIDAMKGTMSPEEFNGFLKGNAFKYLTRACAKDSLEQDLHKVCWYAMFLYLSNGGTVESLGKTFEYMKGRFAK